MKSKNFYTINFSWDSEANVWIAINNEIPIALESESLDNLINRVRIAIPEMLELNRLPRPAHILFHIEREEIVA